MNSILVPLISMATIGVMGGKCTAIDPTQEPVVRTSLAAVPLVSAVCLGEALPVKLTIVNIWSSHVDVRTPFKGWEEGQHVTVIPPSGEPFTLESVGFGYVPDDEDIASIRLAPGERCDFVVLVYKGKSGFLFSETGTYKLSFSIGFAASTQVTITCLAVPQSEEEAYARFTGLPNPSARMTLYDGRFIAGGQFKGSLPAIEALAQMPGSVVYSSYAKFARGEREMCIAEGLLQDQKPLEARQHMILAKQLMSAIPPGSALGHIADHDSYVYLKLAERTEEGKRKHPTPYY